MAQCKNLTQGSSSPGKPGIDILLGCKRPGKVLGNLEFVRSWKIFPVYTQKSSPFLPSCNRL
jgi:hypothetical protein